MLTWRVTLYLVTIACMFLAGAWEQRLSHHLTDEQMTRDTDLGGSLFASRVRETNQRKQVLRTLPAARKRMLRRATVLKFSLLLAFILEVIVLQR